MMWLLFNKKALSLLRERTAKMNFYIYHHLDQEIRKCKRFSSTFSSKSELFVCSLRPPGFSFEEVSWVTSPKEMFASLESCFISFAADKEAQISDFTDPGSGTGSSQVNPWLWIIAWGFSNFSFFLGWLVTFHLFPRRLSHRPPLLPAFLAPPRLRAAASRLAWPWLPASLPQASEHCLHALGPPWGPRVEAAASAGAASLPAEAGCACSQEPTSCL